MKIHNAISLLELQSFMADHNISLKVDRVASANAWRVTILKAGTALGRAGIGRDLGEALKNAFDRYTEDIQ